MTAHFGVLPRTVILLMAAVMLFVLMLSSGAEARPEPIPQVSYRVVAGDTLWSIAGRMTTPEGDVRDSIMLVRDINGLATSAIRAGQVLLLPGS